METVLGNEYFTIAIAETISSTYSSCHAQTSPPSVRLSPSQCLLKYTEKAVRRWTFDGNHKRGKKSYRGWLHPTYNIPVLVLSPELGLPIGDISGPLHKLNYEFSHASGEDHFPHLGFSVEITDHPI